jgi:fibronectin type 3 domain-containing protein
MVEMKVKSGFVAAVVVATLCLSGAVYAADLTISVNAAAPVRTIPETMYGWSMYAWSGYENGYNATFNNIMLAGGQKYVRWPGGSWGDAYLWSDMEGPGGINGWIINYNEELYMLSILGATMQPIVNFPGNWYDVNHPTEAVPAAVAWVQDQTARTPCAQYWEIGNEVYGNWEAGWFAGLDGTYYGNRFADFYIAMKAVNPNIKIGAVAREYDNQYNYWTRNLLTAAKAKGVVPDFLSIHMYPGTSYGPSYNPTLLTFDIGEIANFTSSLNSMITTAIGSQYVGQIEYCMTEWDSGGATNYERNRRYIGSMFVAEYIMEMAKNGWMGNNLFGNFFYESWMATPYPDFYVFPKWYVYPFFINKFGRDMVSASSSSSTVRAYASTDADDNLTLFIVNNSAVSDLTAQVNISGFSSGPSGQRWIMEPAGTMPPGGLTVQDVCDIQINGVFHPEPTTINSLAPQIFASGSTFTMTLPKSCMVFLKVPAGTGDATAPSAPTGLAAIGKAGKVSLNWNDNNEFDLAGYNVYRSTTLGSGYAKLNTSLLSSSDYSDTTVVGGTTYYYVITAVDTSWNESGSSNEASATPIVLTQTVYNFVGINAANTNYNAYYCDVDQFPFGNNSSNRNSMVEATDSQYTYISAIDSSEWAPANPGAGDETFLWNEMKINESPGNITRIDLTFNGYTTNSGAVPHRIFVLKAGADWTLDSSWTQVGDDQSISPGAYATMARSINSNISSYIDGNGKLTWAVYETTSYLVTHVNYLEMAVYTSGSAAPASPVGLTATGGFQTIALDWNDNNESDFVGYNVYRSTTSGYGYSKLNSSLLNSSDYNDTNVIGIPYYYVVTAVDINDNQSVYSNQASATADVFHNCAEVQAAGFGLVSDLDGDCYVDSNEMGLIAYYWLYTDCAVRNNCDGTDFEPANGTVNLLDFSAFAQQWRWCNDPQNPRCTHNW